ncbi:MAG: VOC family protein [Candidatus Nanopelagicales bacterium]
MHAAVTRVQLNLDCLDPDRQQAFWCDALGYRASGSLGPYRALTDPEGRGPDLVLQQVPDAKRDKIRMHLDLYVAPPDLAPERDRLLALGATLAPEGWFELGEERWQVMRDPEGNEFCLCTRGA